MTKEQFDIAASILQIIVLPLTSYGVWVLRGIREHLATINGRIVKLETWQQIHDHQSDRRYEQHTNNIQSLNERIDRFRGSRSPSEE